MRREIIGCAVRWFVLAFLLTALLVITSSGWVLAGILLLFLIPLASWGANAYVRRHIRVIIAAPTTTAKKTAADCMVRVQNDSLLPVLRCFCQIEVINDLTGEHETIMLIGGVGAKKQSVYSFLLQSAYCGRLYISVKSFRLMDYFGILPNKVPVRASARITVLPDLFAMDAEMSAYPAHSDEGSANQRGEDRSEVFQMREYRPGDDLRQIHWKLSSKLGTLVYKEASLPESRSLLVFWDKRTRGTPAQMDALAETVSSVSNGLVQSGIQFCLCWTEQDELLFQDVTDESSLLQAIPALVKNIGDADCQLPDLNQYNRVLYFGLYPEEQMQKDKRVHFVLCSETEIPDATVFSVQNYQETMRRLEV